MSRFNTKIVLRCRGISLRQSWDRHIFIISIPLLVRQHICIKQFVYDSVQITAWVSNCSGWFLFNCNCSPLSQIQMCFNYWMSSCIPSFTAIEVWCQRVRCAWPSIKTLCRHNHSQQTTIPSHGMLLIGRQLCWSLAVHQHRLWKIKKFSLWKQNHGLPSTQPGTFTQPCPIVHTVVPPLAHGRAPGEQWARLCVFTLQGCVQAARLCRGSLVKPWS